MTDYKVINAYRGAQKFEIKVSECDFEFLNAYRWFIANCCRHSTVKLYARRQVTIAKGERKSLYMHRLIAGALPGVVVDHLNGDSLDNRRHNLLVTTQQDNARAERQNQKQRRIK